MLEVVTQSEAAKIVGVYSSTIKYWVDSGKLPVERMGRIVMIRVKDLEEANRQSWLNPERKRGREIISA